jgi:hypothetical protein
MKFQAILKIRFEAAGPSEVAEKTRDSYQGIPLGMP